MTFCKMMYQSVFDTVVAKVNESICKSTENLQFIGILDIFGFEVFQKNCFEQFCINYANEMLQHQFNRFIFQLKQKEYQKEQIDWSTIIWPDNTQCLDY